MFVAGLALLGVTVYYIILTGPLGFALNSRSVIDTLRGAGASAPR